MICNFQISTIMAAIFRYWKLFSHVQSDRSYWCWADTKHNKFHYYIKITLQHHVEITMTLQLRHICSLDKINPVWRCPSNVCIVYPRNGEMKRCSTLFNNVERGLQFHAFWWVHFVFDPGRPKFRQSQVRPENFWQLSNYSSMSYGNDMW